MEERVYLFIFAGCYILADSDKAKSIKSNYRNWGLGVDNLAIKKPKWISCEGDYKKEAYERYYEFMKRRGSKKSLLAYIKYALKESDRMKVNYTQLEHVVISKHQEEIIEKWELKDSIWKERVLMGKIEKPTNYNFKWKSDLRCVAIMREATRKYPEGLLL